MIAHSVILIGYHVFQNICLIKKLLMHLKQNHLFFNITKYSSILKNHIFLKCLRISLNYLYLLEKQFIMYLKTVHSVIKNIIM